MNNRIPQVEDNKAESSADYLDALKKLAERNLDSPENIKLLTENQGEPFLGLAIIVLKTSDLFNDANLSLIKKGLETDYHYQAVNLADALVLIKQFKLEHETQTKLLQHTSTLIISILKKLDFIDAGIINKVTDGDMWYLGHIIKIFEKKFNSSHTYIQDIVNSYDPSILMSAISDLESLDLHSKNKTQLLSEATLNKLFGENGLNYAIALRLLDLANRLNEQNAIKILCGESLDKDDQHGLEKFLITFAIRTSEYTWLRKHKIFEIAAQLNLTSKHFNDFIKTIDLSSLKTIKDLNNIIQNHAENFPEQVAEICSVYKKKYDNHYLDKLSAQTLKLLNKKRLVKVSDDAILRAFLTYHRIKGGTPLPNRILDGICFGSAFCHGLFNTLGMGPWWKAVLEAVAQWDGRRDTLSDLIYLPDNPEPVNLDLLIQMAGQFILKHETIDLTATKFELAVNESQRKLLTPGGAFQIITAEGIKKIQDKLSLILVGDDDLERFIQQFKSSYPNNEVICLIHRNLHTCALHNENGVYFFNGNRGESGPLTSADKIWKKTLQQGPKVLGIDIISLDRKIDADLVKLCESLTSNAIKKIDPAQFKMFIKVLPQRLNQLLTEVENNSDKESLFANALAYEQSYSFVCNLRTLLFEAPETFTNLLDLVKNRSGLHKSFMQAFSSTNDRFTVFELIIHFAASTLPKLFSLMQNLPELENSLEHALINCVDDITPFYRIINLAPVQIPAFFKLLENSEKLQNSLAKTLHVNPGKNYTAIHALAVEHPQHLPALLKLMSNNLNFTKAFANLLCIKTDAYSGWPLLHIIIKNTPNCLPLLVSLAKNNKEMMQAIHNGMSLETTIKTKDGSSIMNGFALVSRYAPGFQTLLNDLYALDKPTSSNSNTIFYHQSLSSREIDVTSHANKRVRYR